MTITHAVEVVRQMARDKPEWTFYFVGGYVRDKVLGEMFGYPFHPKDVDVEVFGDYTEQELVDFCRKYGKVKADVGKSFEALKLTVDSGHPIDVLQPRRDTQKGHSHRTIDTERDPTMTPEEAAERRDFTINAMMIRVDTGELFDFFGGVEDLRNRRLRHLSEAFFGDPLRVLRGMQFCGRFDLIAEPETVAGCRTCVDEYRYLPKERIWDEFYKLFKSPKPSRGLVFLNRSGWIQYFPALALMRRLPQEAKYHPEGSVWQHTKLAVDVAADIARRKELSIEDTVVLVAAAMLHDVGKFDTQEVVDGKILTRQHAKFSAMAAEAFLAEIGAPNQVVVRVMDLVREHMFAFDDFTQRGVRRLSARMLHGSIRMLALLMEADSRGRKRRSILDVGRERAIRRMVEVAEELDVVDSGPAPILMGRHLIEMGFRPGPEFGTVLRNVYEQQLDGVVTTLEDATKLVWVIARVEMAV